MSFNNFSAEWSRLHGTAKISRVVLGWLRISYMLVKPLHVLRISPNLVTLAGLLFGLLTWMQRENGVSVLFLVLSLVADGIDGSLAIVSGRASKFGAHFDSVVDRVVEFLWALTFYKIGAPLIVIALCWTAALAQEYVRARSAGLGHRSIDVITMAERPVRAILLGLALVGHFMNLHGESLLAYVWLILQCQALVVVLRDSYTALSANNRFGN